MSKESQHAANCLKEIERVTGLLSEDMKKMKWAVYAKNLAASSSIIGNLVVIGFSMFGGGTDPMKQATEKLMNRLDGISQQITNSTSELKDFIAQTNFCTEIKAPVEHLTYIVKQFVKNKDQRSLDKMHEVKSKPIELLNKIISILDCACGVEAQLERRWYTDAAFDEMEALYQHMVKQLIFAYGMIERTVYKRNDSTEVEELARIIESKLAKANSDRADKYWDMKFMDGLMNHCMVVHSSNEAARDDLYKTMYDRYGKTGYNFAVGVYNGCSGWENHCISGPQHLSLFRRNGRNAFVLRNRKASSYRNSSFISHARTWVIHKHKPEIYFDLREMTDKIKKMDDYPASMAVVRDYNGLREKLGDGFETYNYPHTLTFVVAKKPR